MKRDKKVKLEKERKVLLPVTLSRKQQSDIYKAELLTFPELKALEYQCSKKELKLFKVIVIRAFIKDALEEFIKGHNE